MEVLRLLLNAGASPNVPVRNYGGETPVYFSLDDISILKLLIDSGADILHRTREGHVPLHFAVRRRLHEAVSLLIARGARPDDVSKSLDTALHMAAAQSDWGMLERPPTLRIDERIQIVQSLLTAGANPDARNSKGLRPIDLVPAGAEFEKLRDLLRVPTNPG